MSLREQQNLMARLYMDEELRRSFLSEPAGTARPFGLSEREIEDLASILPGEIGEFSASLFRKRLREVERMIPLTRRALDTDFEAAFRQYIDANPSSAELKRRDDALEFCRYCERHYPGKPAAAAAFERAKIEFNTGRKNLVVLMFQGKFRLWLRIGRRTWKTNG